MEFGQIRPPGPVTDKAALAAEIGRLLPDFVKSCGKNEDFVIIHQDSFAADYQQGN
jgi:hypothetical protein